MDQTKQEQKNAKKAARMIEKEAKRVARQQRRERRKQGIRAVKTAVGFTFTGFLLAVAERRAEKVRDILYALDEGHAIVQTRLEEKLSAIVAKQEALVDRTISKAAEAIRNEEPALSSPDASKLINEATEAVVALFNGAAAPKPNI